MTEIEPADPITRLALAWHAAGQRAPTPVPSGETTCMVPDCGQGGWVQVKTNHGPIVVCFEHFQDLRPRIEAVKAANARPRRIG